MGEVIRKLEAPSGIRTRKPLSYKAVTLVSTPRRSPCISIDLLLSKTYHKITYLDIKYVYGLRFALLTNSLFGCDILSLFINVYEAVTAVGF